MSLILIAATRNKNKFKEITKILRGSGIRLKSLNDLPPVPEVVENGRTLEANAIKKAVTISKIFGAPALSDDSGLFVHALGGKPGVRSARYASPKGDYAANNSKLLKALNPFKGQQRKAYFATTIALAWPGQAPITFTGKLSGKIISENRGTNGFGYDPVFVPRGYTKTLAEMTITEKNQLSHRSRALAKILNYLRNTLEKKIIKG